MIQPKDVDDLLDSFRRRRQSIAEWCAKNDMEETALVRVVETYGGHPDSRAVAICTFQLGYEMRRQVEPKSATIRAPGKPRYAVQRVVIDTTDGSIVVPPTPKAEYADGLAATFNEVSLTSR